MAEIQRQVAHKVWIKNIINSNYVKQEGWKPNYVEFGGKQVSRVNLLATAVSRFLSDDGNYGALTLDDGTETIRVKAFGPDVSKISEISDAISSTTNPALLNFMLLKINASLLLQFCK